MKCKKTPDKLWSYGLDKDGNLKGTIRVGETGSDYQFFVLHSKANDNTGFQQFFGKIFYNGISN